MARIRYTGGATVRTITAEDTGGELSQDYTWAADTDYTLPLAEADRDWFATLPGDDFQVIDTAEPRPAKRSTRTTAPEVMPAETADPA